MAELVGDYLAKAKRLGYAPMQGWFQELGPRGREVVDVPESWALPQEFHQTVEGRDGVDSKRHTDSLLIVPTARLGSGSPGNRLLGSSDLKAKLCDVGVRPQRHREVQIELSVGRVEFSRHR